MEIIKLEKPFKLVSRGKVRDLYTLEGNHSKLFFIATDRVSAYDVVLKTRIPDKGKLLTAISAFWFKILDYDNHLITAKLEEMPIEAQKYKDLIDKRTMLVKRLEIVPIEAIVRGYLTGSAWSEYKTKGTIHGMEVPSGFVESQVFEQPKFTPSTKAQQGKDENISFQQLQDLVGKELALRIQQVSIDLYTKASKYALERGVIIADTKFEFGLDINNQLILADEVLTPDSSRFWLAKDWQLGKTPVSMDKQYIRDWLTKSNLKGIPNVDLPPDIVSATVAKYQQITDILTK